MALRDQKGAARLALPVVLALTLTLPLPLLSGCKEETTPARQRAAAPPAAGLILSGAWKP